MKYFGLFLLLLIFSSNSFAKDPKLFSLTQAKDKLEEFARLKTEHENIELYQLKVFREGSGKIFTLEQAINAKIADKFQIIEANFSDKTFSAKLQQSENSYILEVNGKIKKLIKIPVLSQNIGRETVITQDMLEFKKIPQPSVRRNNIVNISDLMGTVSARNLSKGRAINYSDVKKPIIVKKNDIVQALYIRKNMEVKLLAVAQQNAAEGDVIRLKNYDSGALFEGKINSAGQAIISPEVQKLEMK